jgi:beta-1,4-mannosyl-glycoprotein beta-1,4-N-acetylglucosaminyltransferase
MKLIDCFCFLNEIDLLEIRLNELDGVVDQFVIVEANYTGSRREKPYILESHISTTFSQFPIKYIKIDLGPYLATSTDQHGPMYEQRNAIKYAVANEPDDSLIMMSDLDEIPRRSVLEGIKHNGLPKNPTVLALRGFYWFINCYINSPDNHVWFRCPLISTKDYFMQQDLRAYRDNKDSQHCIENAGWHYSHVGTPQHKREKMLASSHTEYNSEHYTAVDQIERRSNNAIDPYDRGFALEIVNVHHTDMPLYLRSNLEKFNHLWKNTKS